MPLIPDNLSQTERRLWEIRCLSRALHRKLEVTAWTVLVPSIAVTVADCEGTVVEQVVLGGEPGDRVRTEIMAPAATIQAGQSAEVQVLVREMFVAAPFRSRYYKYVRESTLCPVMP